MIQQRYIELEKDFRTLQAELEQTTSELEIYRRLNYKETDTRDDSRQPRPSQPSRQLKVLQQRYIELEKGFLELENMFKDTKSVLEKQISKNEILVGQNSALGY